MTEIVELNTLDSSESWVHDVLEPDQFTGSKIPYGRRQLSRGTIVLLWALRLYVVFMVFIVGLAIWNTLHTAG
ncbi:MAG: hypothetical protein LV481_17185 [Methylacidiphilales bacterium]|nr:hypothetical protein [Candidatus Methylacidiphilales bacterium]